MCVCVYVCVTETEREREKEWGGKERRNKQTRQTDRRQASKLLLPLPP